MALFRNKKNKERLQKLFDESSEELNGVKIINIFSVLEILADDLGKTVEQLDYRVSSQFVQKMDQTEPVSLYSAPEKNFNLEEAVFKAKRENNMIVIVESL